MLPQIAYVTHGGDTGTDPDIPLALAAFANAGMQAATVRWDDNDMRWDAFDVILMGPGRGSPVGARSSCGGRGMSKIKQNSSTRQSRLRVTLI